LRPLYRGALFPAFRAKRGIQLAFKINAVLKLMTIYLDEAANCCGLMGPVLWQTVDDDHTALDCGRRLRPKARQLDQCHPLFFRFGSSGPKNRILGVLPELCSLGH
jgi:hypothetical protein